MGKKSKKIKKELKTLVKGNKVLFAALGGAAAGLTLAGIFGSEKGKAILDTVEDSITNTADRIANGHLKTQSREVAKST